MIWMMAAIYILLPLALFYHLLKTDFGSKKVLVIDWLLLLMFIAFIFILGPWHIYSHYLRWLWPVLFILVSFFAFRRLGKLPAKGPKKSIKYKFSMGFSIVLFVYFGLLAANGITGYILPDKDEAIELEFPMKDGVYAVGHGGANPSINYHNEYIPQQYAYDILQVNGLGLRGAGLSPTDLDKYKIYGTPLYSPCSGEVVAAVDEYDDIAPQESPDKKASPAGNHVILSCEGANIHLAHMKPGTVEVQEGDQVNTGDQLGEVGNTGNTTEPHLHIHAEKDGEGVPILFDGRFLKRNSLVFN
ncbi:M23 family metallopeptidase [Sediminibacillus massiliensis]|uniref:M23 family metallopeptidase n=1 Tax=Sediminibacillus massiliensis TaxID=1926277 RepID=UPI0009883A44|nr:M23 family metallopeptidase [Sediminibacillus massiliensis]